MLYLIKDAKKYIHNFLDVVLFKSKAIVTQWLLVWVLQMVSAVSKIGQRIVPVGGIMSGKDNKALLTVA